MGLKENILGKLYLHRRGIMGTVIFHLLLAILLLSMGLSNVNVHQEMEVILETPAPEEVQKRVEEEVRKEEIRKKTSDEEVERLLRSVVSNENARDKKGSREADVQKYIDEVMEDLNNSGENGRQANEGRYKVKRDKDYRRDSLQHARDRKEQQLDSLKSTFYSGESSVSYDLKDRFARFLPIPVFKCEFGGKVVVTITVNRKGIVQKAVIAEGQSGPDECLRDVAVDASLRSRFNEKPDAPALQTGTITFNFVKQ